jgi:hypothetical protein
VAGLVLATVCGVGGAARAERAADPTFSDLQQAPTPEAAYAANAYAIVHVGKTDRVNEPGSTWRPVRGLVYRISLDPDVFLESAGRPDLATRERSHHNSARTLSVAGYLFGCAGVVVAVAGFGYGHNVIGVVGLGSLVGGAIAHEVGEARLDPVLPEDRALQLAADYNRDLRVRLGLPAEVAPPRRDPWTRGPAPGFAAAPLLLARGGGLGLGFRF